MFEDNTVNLESFVSYKNVWQNFFSGGNVSFSKSSLSAWTVNLSAAGFISLHDDFYGNKQKINQVEVFKLDTRIWM